MAHALANHLLYGISFVADSWPVGTIISSMQFMDSSDVCVRHAVKVTDNLLVTHIIDLSPSAVRVAKDVRNCVLAAVLAWAVISILKNRKAAQ